MANRPSSDYDLIVVGAGVLGAFAAYHAARMGYRVALLERTAGPRAASVRNFGMLIPSAIPPGPWRRRALESLAIYRELIPHLSNAGVALEPGGTLYVAHDALEAQILQEYPARLGPEGYPAHYLAPEAVRALVPDLVPTGLVGGLHCPDDYRLDPVAFFPAFLEYLRESLQVDYRPRTSVAAVHPLASDQGAEVQLAQGQRLTTARMLICCGSELRALYPDRLAHAGMKHCQLLMMEYDYRSVSRGRWQARVASGLTLRRYQAFSLCPSWPELSARPLAPALDAFGIHILLVQDRAGRLIVGDSHQDFSDEPPDHWETAIEDEIVRETQKLVALGSTPIHRRWLGVYTKAPSHDEMYHNFVTPAIQIVTGIGGKGMTTGPGLMAEVTSSMLRGLTPTITATSGVR